MKRIFLLSLLTLTNTLLFSQPQTDTLELYFETDHYKNTEEHIQKLKTLENLDISSFTINAFTDSVASSTYNQKLSNKRAYYTYFSLLKMNFPIEIFQAVEGFGEDQNHMSYLDSSRRVSIIYQYKTKKIEEALIPNQPKKKIIAKKIEEQISNGEVGDKIIAKNINFEPGNHRVLPQSLPELKQLYKALEEHPEIKIEIRGHICCQYNGQDGYDAISKDNHLSVNRAFAVYSYLISKGINKDRLSYKGYGSTQKIYEIEQNDREKVANRRVEIIITENK